MLLEIGALRLVGPTMASRFLRMWDDELLETTLSCYIIESSVFLVGKLDHLTNSTNNAQTIFPSIILLLRLHVKRSQVMTSSMLF
jgi:hypothetical protein